MRALFREFVVAQERAIREANRDVTLAWQIGILTQSKPKPLRELLLKRVVSLDDQFAETAMHISAFTGRDPKRVRMIRRPVVAHVG